MNQLYIEAGFFFHLSHSCLMGHFVLIDMASGPKPLFDFLMVDQKDLVAFKDICGCGKMFHASILRMIEEKCKMWSTASMSFQKLLAIADTLLGENGCPWDLKQTYMTLRRSLLEEAYEVVEAIDNKDLPNLVEELGDLLYNIVFLAKIGQKRKEFDIDEVCELVHDKLISRHPHIFGDAKAHDADSVIELWEAAKAAENKKDELPKVFPALLKAYKLAKKKKVERQPSFSSEEELGQKLWQLACEAKTAKLDPEAALRSYLHVKTST